MKFLFSRRAWIIYSWFLITPIVVTGLWILIPVYKFNIFAISSSIFFSVSFLVWTSFNDFVIPGLFVLLMVLRYVIVGW